MKTNKLINLIFLSFILFLINISTILAACEANCMNFNWTTRQNPITLKIESVCVCLDAEPAEPPTGGSPTNVTGCACGDACWTAPYNFGFRLTVLDKDTGKELTDSYDFLYANDSEITKYRALPNKGSKIDYLNRTSVVDSEFSVNYGTDYTLASTILPFDANTKFTYNSGSGLAAYFKKITNSKADRLLNVMGMSLDEFYEEEDYLMVEPLVFLYYHGSYYVGTATELALLWNKSDVSKTSGQCGFNNITHQNLPWSVYIEGDYFGKLVGVKSLGLTPGSSVESSQIVGGNGLGVGLFWTFGESETKDNPNCPDAYCDSITTVINPTGCDSTGTYSDPTDWCCIEKDGSSPEYNQYAVEGRNKYCPAYCREDVTTTFPSSALSVEAGKHFVFNPVGTAQSEKQCRSKINLQQWYNDYINNEQTMAGKYHEWKAYEELGRANYSNVINSYSTTTYSCKYTIITGKRIIEESSSTPCKKRLGFTLTETSTTTYYADFSFPRVRGYGNTHERIEGTNSTAIREQAKGIVTQVQQQNREAASAAKRAYESTIVYRNSLKANLRECQTIASSGSKVANFNLLYRYEGINKDYEKVSIESETTSTDPVYKYESNIVLPTITDYTCSGIACVKGTVYNFPKNTKVETNYMVSTTFTLKDDLYRYVLKKTGKSVNMEAAEFQSNYGVEYEKGLYYEIPYSNLPVHYTLAPGNYLYYIEYSSVGTMHKFTVSSSAHDESINNKPAYVCYYNVFNDLFGDECNGSNPPSYCKGTRVKGLDVIYRPIDLGNPFPGKSGKDVGRISGVNWRYGGTIFTSTVTNYDKTLVDYYITNNRGVKTEEVYQKDPMYEIVLTPSLIKEIRRYNDEQEKGYTDFNLTCINGRKCQSDFIRNSSISDYITGCGTKTWDQCDNEDNHPRNK